MTFLRFSLINLFFILAIIVHSTAFAYKRKHYIKLLETKVCRNCDLNSAPLSMIDLTGADLRGSTLVNAKFKKSTLYKAKLPKPDYYWGADFTGAMWVDGGICQTGSIGKCACYTDIRGGSSCSND